MDFQLSAKASELRDRIKRFIQDEIGPVERELLEKRERHGDWRKWSIPPAVEDLKRKARDAGLWNLFLPEEAGLSNVEYAPLAEEMGRSFLAPEVFNCNAPDTGNMEVLAKYGSKAQKAEWLEPLLKGEIRSAFCMTEPDVASSDATNMAATALIDGDEVVLNGKKWWSTGIGHPNCRVVIFMGVTDGNAHRHSRHSMVLVPLDTPGVEIQRMVPVFGEYDAPYGHGEIWFTDARVPKANLIAGPGRGFEIAQGRLGPGRIHHCMRFIGLGERAIEAMCRRARNRSAFGSTLAEMGAVRKTIGQSRCALEQARLITLKAAWVMDQAGNKAARNEIAMAKIIVPTAVGAILDRAIQIHGGAGLSQDFFLAEAFAETRFLRIGDGPDEVHREALARVELARH